jgi:hypothetical protein
MPVRVLQEATAINNPHSSVLAVLPRSKTQELSLILTLARLLTSTVFVGLLRLTLG